MSDDDIFCVKRVWDERAEAGYMKKIEDAFQDLADKVISGAVATIGAEQNEQISAFFALWRIRADYRKADHDPISFRGVTGCNWTKDQEEKFEKSGVSFLREGGAMPARIIHGLKIQRAIDDYMVDLSNVRWGIIRAQEGHIIVPDYPSHTIIPLLPMLCLCSGGQSGIVTLQNVAEINCAFRRASLEYFFAMDFKQCP